MLCWLYLYLSGCINPNAQKSYKISQKLSPKHATRGVAQSPYPTYSHGKVHSSKQLLWRAAADPRLACGCSRFRAPARWAHCARFSSTISRRRKQGRVF